MAAFAAILDGKLDAGGPTSWSWRPSPVFPFFQVSPAPGPVGGRAYVGASSPEARTATPPEPQRPAAVVSPRRLTPVQTAALATLQDLGARLDPSFEVDDLKRAFRMLARRYHPDHAATSDGAAFRDLHAAYRILLSVE